MKIKTSELTGAALNRAVAMANNETYEDYRVEDDGLLHALFCGTWLSHAYDPAGDWSQGGSIIEREYININHPNGSNKKNDDWIATWKFGGYEEFRGSTPLIAAMRCYVASKLGEEVEIPEELAP